MNKPIESTGDICFWTEASLCSFKDLAAYIGIHATGDPISGSELANARVLDIDHPSVDNDDLPEANEFTPAEAKYLISIIEEAIADPKRKSQYIRMEVDEDDPELTIVEIQFPPHLEAPAELR